MQKLVAFCCIVVALSAAAFFLEEHQFFSGLENRLWDLRVRATATPAAADRRIKLIVVDQHSLDYFAEAEGYSWPWPRALYSYVIRFLERGGAKGVAFDMLYTEHSFWGVEDDLTFAKSLDASLPVVLAAAALDDERVTSPSRLALFRRAQEAQLADRDFVARFLTDVPLPPFVSVLLPEWNILRHARLFGNVRATVDDDGVFRHTQPGVRIGSTPLASLPLMLYAATTPAAEQRNLARFTDPQGRLAIRFFGPEQTYEHFSIADIIKSEQMLAEGLGEPSISPTRFKDALVFVSVGAPGLFDSHPTPLSATLLGVEYNANILDNLLHDSFVSKPSAPVRALQILIFVALAAAAPLFIRRIRLQAPALAALVLGVL
ncbi:MAG: CHASE2 domain-containing protein, partial [Bdellovibrionales bacterium]|nr:CHASE2 domain-containing protein [Bdellovibrionales bacterium]